MTELNFHIVKHEDSYATEIKRLYHTGSGMHIKTIGYIYHKTLEVDLISRINETDLDKIMKQVRSIRDNQEELI